MAKTMKLRDLKLSPTQLRAFKKLIKYKGWFTAYGLGETRGTLDSLFKRGLVLRRGVSALGSMYSPRTSIEYKAKYRYVG